MHDSEDRSRLEEQVQALLDQLRLSEKLAMLDGDTPFWGGMADIALHDTSHRRPWPAGVVSRLGIGGLHFVDGPRGVTLEGGATTFPAPIGRGASWDVELEERIGEAMGREARSFGANLFGGVCVNLLRHPGWGRAQETFGEDPVHVGAMGAAMTRGVQRHAIACVKHFALNSIDSARFRVDVSASERVLQELYLPQFRDCVEAGALSVMSAYNSVNGAWCGQHLHLLTRILKERWGFRGFVVTDFIFGIRDGVRALRAGQDLEMPFRMIFEATLPEAVAEGRVSMERIDDAVRRLLRAQLSLPEGTYPVSLRGCEEHRALAREAAVKSIVLLRNEGAVLPLTGLGSLAVIGPLADTPNLGDRGSSDTRPAPGSVVTPLAGLRAAAPELAVHPRRWHRPGRRRRPGGPLRRGPGGGGSRLAPGGRTHPPRRPGPDPAPGTTAGWAAAPVRPPAPDAPVVSPGGQLRRRDPPGVRPTGRLLRLGRSHRPPAPAPAGGPDPGRRRRQPPHGGGADGGRGDPVRGLAPAGAGHPDALVSRPGGRGGPGGGAAGAGVPLGADAVCSAHRSRPPAPL